MSVLVVVQARAGSTRLPGKVLMDVDGRPLLRFMLDRLRPLADAEIVVATSTESRDDAVAACAADAGVAVVRGPEADVLARFGMALDAHPAAHVVRLTADCPLVDPWLVREAIDLHVGSGADYTSNTLIRTFPDGLDVEVMTAAALRTALEEAVDPAEREHVTPFLYRHNRRFALRALRSPERLGHLRWTVDTADDLDRVRRMVAIGAAEQDGWIGLLHALPLEERRLLREGLEPALAGEVPDHVTTFDDPGHQALVAVVGDRAVGWLIADIEDGQVRVTGDVLDEHLDAIRSHFVAFAASTPQITGGDIALATFSPIGAPA